jgi:hypothetical protein
VVEKDRCPEDHNRQTPPHTAADDFVELERTESFGAPAYRVRIYRNGLIAWHGEKGNDAEGDRAAQIGFAAAESLLALFFTDEFWHACSVEMPSTVPDEDGELPARIPSLTVRIGGSQKSVNFGAFSFADEDIGPRLAWAVDKAAGTHRWRHGDAASESFGNVREDLLLPKGGITKLMRAVWRFNPSTAQITLEPLRHFLADGADVDAADESGWTALMYAAQLGTSDPAGAQALLLNAKASVDKPSLHGDTALAAAAYGGHLNTLLLEHGAQINHANAEGVTVLMLLATRHYPDEVQQALKHGADVNARDQLGRTALDYLNAAACGHPIVPPPRWTSGGWIESSTTPACPPDDEGYRSLQKLLRPTKPER